MGTPQGKRGLGWYSMFVYPLLFAAFVWVVLYFEFARQDNWAIASGLPTPEVLDTFYVLQKQLFIGLAIVLVVGIIWNIIVRRDKRNNPQKYRKY